MIWEESFISKKAFLFQGVGSDIDKSIEVLNDDEKNHFYELCSQASDFTKLDLKKYLLDRSSLYGLDRTFAEWIITGLCDCTVYDSMINHGIQPDYVAGYSLGLNNVCYCLGSITLEESITILKGVISSIYEASKSKEQYGMGVIIGLDYETVNSLIVNNTQEGRLAVSSINSETFIVVSGFLSEVKTMLQKSAEEGAIKNILLDVPCAFHSSLMKEYSEPYFSNLQSLKFKNINIPIVSVYSQKIITAAEDIYNEQKRNFLEPMKWKQTIKSLENAGVTEFWDMSTLAAVKKASRLNNPDSKFKTIKSLRVSK